MAISDIEKSGSWYYLFDEDGKKYKTLSISSIGDIVSVSGDSFVAESGSWVHTYDKTGKKINTRSAR